MNDHRHMYFQRINKVNLQTTALFSHIFCWSIFIVYELTFLHYSGGKLQSVFRYICFYGLNISFFYLQIAICNKTFYKGRKHFFAGLLLLLLLFAVNISIKTFLSNLLVEIKSVKISPEQKRTFLIANLYRMFYFATLAGFYSLADHIGSYRKHSLIAEKKLLEGEQEKTALELRLADTRNAYLQQQMNPHMLFNALNFLYTASRKSAPGLSKSVLLLSDMMRFNLDGAGEDGKVLLTEEIQQIYNLAEISKQQFDQGLYLDISVEGAIDKFRIIPLVLFTLSENVFKHGNLVDPDRPASLTIQVSPYGELVYTSRNLKKERHDFRQIRSLGIQNIRTRMEFSYAGKYELNLVDAEQYFETNLSIAL